MQPCLRLVLSTASLSLLGPYASAGGGDTFEFITEISPGTVYSFEGDAVCCGTHDFTESWFLNETFEPNGVGGVTSNSTSLEEQIVQYLPNDTHVTEERWTFHVFAQSASSVLPFVDGASFSARQVWAFQVTDPGGAEDDRPLDAVLSGRLWLLGMLQVYGPGAARLEARCTVRERLPSASEYLVGPVVASHEICAYEIDHANGVSVGAALQVIGGLPFLGGGAGVGADRPASNERIRFDHEFVDFSFPLTVQVGRYYELEVGVFGHAENRGLPYNISTVYFKNADGLLADAGEGTGSTSTATGPADPSHILKGIDYFGLALPEVQFFKAFTGKESWDFPKLGQIFDGKKINMSNNFKLEPVGKIDSILDALEKLGISPNLGDKLASSAPPGLPGPQAGEDDSILDEGGIWLSELVMSTATH